MNLTPLSRAITAVGGQSELARRIGKTQGHISSWLRRDAKVPAECVLAIEEATGRAVTRHDLRPDIFGPPSSEQPASGAGLASGAANSTTAFDQSGDETRADIAQQQRRA